jgi:transposase
MEQHAGIDVSLKLSSVCIVDASGKIVKESKVASEPEALVGFFNGLGFPVARIGLEAGPLSKSIADCKTSTVASYALAKAELGARRFLLSD